tara:strand:+ start:905 stop:2032 length:1128 start_codon:yes stop_codon:yes gene_type:complete
MTSAVLILMPVAFIVSLILTGIVVRVGRRMGAMDTPGAAGHAKSVRNVPNIGGIAIAWPLIGGLLVGMLLVCTAWDSMVSIVPALSAYEARLDQTAPTVLAFAIGLLLLHVMGLIDDRRSIGPWPKLLLQIGIAAVMAIWFDVRLLRMIDEPLGIGPVPSVIITVVWIVVITNAINFLDNMDGLASGVAAIACSFLMAAAILNEQWFIAATLAVLIGSLVGFLVFNFPPAKIFMGDGGSLVIGFALAVLVVRTTFYNPVEEGTGLGSGWYGIFMPLAILAVPLYDLITVSCIRISQGRSPLVGDQQHYSHRLVARGLSNRGAVIVIWGATLVTGIAGVSLAHLAPWQAVLAGIQVLLIVALLAVLEHASRGARTS